MWEVVSGGGGGGGGGSDGGVLLTWQVGINKSYLQKCFPVKNHAQAELFWGEGGGGGGMMNG